MPQVQKTQSSDHQGTGPLDDGQAQGLLESANGVVRLISYGEHVASCFNSKKIYVSSIYSVPVDPKRPQGDDVEHHIEWSCWRFDEIRWKHKAALMFLQGSSMQQLVVPYLLLRARPMPPYDPWPGAYEVVMAELHVAPDPPLDHRTMFSLLAPDAHRLSRGD